MSDPIAKQDIESGQPGRGIYAFRRGQSVPADLVKSNGWEDYVVGASTKEARQIHAEIFGEPVAGSDSATTTTTSAQKG